MGYDASCTLRVSGTTSRGTAWLEHKNLVFRGAQRLSIPLSSVTSVEARDGILYVRYGNRSAEFEIGDSAAKWAARIANPPSRLDKLGIKAGTRVMVVDLRDDEFSTELAGRKAEIVSARAANADAIFFAAEDRRALDRLQTLKHAMQPAGAIWVVRPKGQKSITEADSMAAGRRAGLVDVKVVSFSDTHTAEKFVIPVAKRKPRVNR